MSRPAVSPFVDAFDLPGSPQGPLLGLRVAVKDLFDVAGVPTGAGNPDWRADHPVPTRTASAVTRLLDAGARVVGKAMTDELAYSLGGENFHYGTPLNPAAPGRTPGGSSSGPAAATAQGLAEIGLGTDTGGSVRVPAAYCGLFGIRPSHGAIPTDGLVALAPRFDTVGWFARDAATLTAVGRVLLPETATPEIHRLRIATPLFAALPSQARASLAPALAALHGGFADAADIDFDPGLCAAGAEAFRVLQGREIWRVHGAWISRRKPAFGPGVAERFAMCATLTATDAAAAEAAAEPVRVLAPPPGTVLCLPTTPGIAPRLGAPAADLAEMRVQLMRLTCIAGLAGAPQVHLPVARLDGAPFGLSLLGAPGSDSALLDCVAALAVSPAFSAVVPRS